MNKKQEPSSSQPHDVVSKSAGEYETYEHRSTGSQRPNRSLGQLSRSARLGFAVKVLGKEGLRSHDSRRWQNAPHLRVSLGYLGEVFSYLSEADIRMYRMASGLAPYVTHPDHPEFHGQVAECVEELERIGGLAKRMGVRLSFHPGQYIVINSTDEGVAMRSIADLEVQARILETMGLGDEAVVVTHIGGAYGDRQAALTRFASRTEMLSPVAQRRLVVENDDRIFGVEDALLVHKMTGLRVVFDAHHHQSYNPGGIPTSEAAQLSIGTWSGWDVPAKVHFSSPRAEGGRGDGDKQQNFRAHARFIDPDSFIEFYRPLAHLAPDVMLEAKAKDKALMQLRRELGMRAPDLADCFQPERKQLKA